MCHPLVTFATPDPDGPATIVDLVDRICFERTRFEALLKPAPPEPPAGGGWPMDTHLAHLTFWRRVLLDVLHGRLLAADIPDVESLGAASLALDRSPAAVLNEFRAVHLDALAEVAALPDEDLARVIRPDGLTLRDFIAACTYRHDRRHREEIESNR